MGQIRLLLKITPFSGEFQRSGMLSAVGYRINSSAIYDPDTRTGSSYL
jgi:hypothetical protein